MKLHANRHIRLHDKTKQIEKKIDKLQVYNFDGLIYIYM